ncbi:MAG TPA: hypothetical protein VGA45_18460 [Actinomycetota bacterium]
MTARADRHADAAPASEPAGAGGVGARGALATAGAVVLAVLIAVGFRFRSRLGRIA